MNWRGELAATGGEERWRPDDLARFPVLSGTPRPESPTGSGQAG